MKDRVLIIEDDEAMRASLTQSLELEDIAVLQADGLAQARRTLRANFPGVVLSDIRMPKADGFDVLARVQDVDSDLPVIFLTGEADVPMAVRALRAGVYDFLEKPCSVETLLRVVRRALAHRRLVLQARRLESVIEHSDAAAVHFPGSTTASIQLRKDLRHLAGLKTNVHVHGEPGAGRRLAAHTLHFLSDDDTSAITLTFSKPERTRELATFTRWDDRTVILKNIQTAGPDERERALAHLRGARGVRVVTTADRPLDDLPSWKAGLEALGETVSVRVPDLAARHADLPLIFENLVRQAARNLDTDMPEISAETLDRITAREWRGNLPELRREARDLVLGASERNDGESAGLAEQVLAFEKSLLIAALRKHDGVAVRAAEHLKLPRKTFYDKLARHGIEPRAHKSTQD